KLGMDMLSDRGMLAPGEDSAPAMGMFVTAYMWSLGVLIAGGTANIQRNIIAERGFGLPRDAAASRRGQGRIRRKNGHEEEGCVNEFWVVGRSVAVEEHDQTVPGRAMSHVAGARDHGERQRP